MQSRYIEAGKKEGATVETGGERHGNEGYFIQPTIFSNVKESMQIVKEEIFGPVCSIAKFKTMEDGIRMGNETSYGLASAGWCLRGRIGPADRFQCILLT